MSTKIYNGWRLNMSAHPLGLNSVVDDLRDRMLPVYTDTFSHLLVARAVASIDSAALAIPLDPDTNDLKDGGMPAINADMLMGRQLRDAPDRRTGNLQFESVFISDPEDPDWLYALDYTHVDKFRDVFAATAGLEGWPYWNNTDHPDDVTRQDWEHRRVVWSRVMRDAHAAPVTLGLGWRMLGDMHLTSWFEIRRGNWVPYVPTDGDRRDAQARRLGNARYKPDIDPDHRGHVNTTEILDGLRDAVRAARDELASWDPTPVALEDLERSYDKQHSMGD